MAVVCVIAAIAGNVAGTVNALNENPSDITERTFLKQFVFSGGPIVWFILLPLSVFTIHQGLGYWLTIRQKNLLPKNFAADIICQIRNNGCKSLAEYLQNNNDMVSTAIARAVMYITPNKKQIQLQLQLQNVVAESLGEQTLKLMRKIEPTNIIGNVAPMIGLFGTVFGMIKLFNSIVVSGGQPRPEQMADGISVALVTTFWGLLIAIPSLAVHCISKNKIESIAAEAAVEAEMIIVEIKKSVEDKTLADSSKNEN